MSVLSTTINFVTRHRALYDGRNPVREQLWRARTSARASVSQEPGVFDGCLRCACPAASLEHTPSDGVGQQVLPPGWRNLLVEGLGVGGGGRDVGVTGGLVGAGGQLELVGRLEVGVAGLAVGTGVVLEVEKLGEHSE